MKAILSLNYDRNYFFKKSLNDLSELNTTNTERRRIQNLIKIRFILQKISVQKV